jgi:membrane protease subunit (stomatin/prohibitin family)
MARTAVVAGTATAVSNRVSRRQAGRWAQQDMAADYEQEQYAPPPPAPAAPAAPAADDRIAELKKLAELRDAGVLTEDEFAAEKTKILNS